MTDMRWYFPVCRIKEKQANKRKAGLRPCFYFFLESVDPNGINQPFDDLLAQIDIETEQTDKIKKL